MRRAAVLVALALLGASACSGGAAAKVNAGASAAHSSAAPLPTKADLEGKLLTVQDLPSEWSIDTSPDNDDPSASPACLNGIDDGTSNATAKAKFIAGQDFPTIEETLDSYSAAKMGPELDGAMKVIDSCGTFVLNDKGVQIAGAITRLPSFPKFGDRSAAWDMEMHAAGYEFHSVLLLVIDGSSALTFTYSVQGADAVPAAETFASAAVAKL